MANLLDIVAKDSTDRSVTIRIIDSSDGTPETGVVYNTSGIDLWYRREGAAKTSITEATLAALTTSHTDGGFLHIGDGEYRLDLPDAAFATGANYVDVGGTVTGMVVIGGRVRLVDFDLETATQPVNVTQLGGVTQSLTDLKDFADTGYDPSSHKVAGVVLVDGLTTNNDKTGYSLTNLTVQASTTLVSGSHNPQSGDAYTPANQTNTNFISWVATGASAALTTYDGPTNAEMVAAFGALNDPTAGAIADAVWDEAISGHTTADTFGAKNQKVVPSETLDDYKATGFSTLDAAGVRTAVGLAAADLDTQLGMIFEDTNESLPLELSAISAYIDTEVAAIKAVTDAIPDSGAMTSIAQESTVAGLSFSTFDVSSDTVITASIYTARVDLTIDGANSQDEYTVQWLKNGAPVAVTGTPQIQVVKRADGTDLVAATNMTQIGSVNGAYKYDEGTNRITAGEAVLITCTATIDAVTRTWTVPLARDSS